MVMTELMASDGLFTASIVTAMEWVSMPTTALKAARRTFAPMPRTLVLTMVATAAGAWVRARSRGHRGRVLLARGRLRLMLVVAC